MIRCLPPAIPDRNALKNVMPRDADRTGLYQLLLVACRAALALGQFRAAYHSLEAACACARSVGKWEWLDEVATVAQQLRSAAR